MSGAYEAERYRERNIRPAGSTRLGCFVCGSNADNIRFENDDELGPLTYQENYIDLCRACLNQARLVLLAAEKAIPLADPDVFAQIDPAIDAMFGARR